MKNLLWITRRKDIFVKITIDLLIIISLLVGMKNFYLLINIIFIWSISSYIQGRYSTFKIDPSSLNWFKFQIKELFFLLVLIFFEIALFIKLFNLDILELSYFKIINNIFLISLLSLSIQFIYFRIFQKDNTNIKKILFISNKANINPTLNYIENYKNYDLIFSNDIESLNIDINLYKEIIITGSEILSDNFFKILRDASRSKIPIFNDIEWIENNYKFMPLDLINDYQMFTIKWKSERNSFQQRIKRIGDLTFCMIFFLPSFLIIFISAILIKLEDGGPVFFKQIRTGLWGKKFEIFKLRTMKINAEEKGAQWAVKNDKRITKIGNILRKFRIDELPQLVQVIRGDMSLIGPRPERPEIDKVLKRDIKYYSMRNWIKPGLSGWAQVNLPYGASIEDSKNKFSYELFYLKNFSFLLDIIIFFKTLKLIFTAKGSQPLK
jgi:lipopolysaccharide/colanic/teichoic acid biosynthesis glycosyltransferase